MNKTPNSVGLRLDCQLSIVNCQLASRRAGVKPGDVLLAVNGNPVHDILDVQYHTAASNLLLRLQRDGVERLVRLKLRPGEDLGLEFAAPLPDGTHTCRNRCIFCFIDQNPPGCRPSLWLKDDDARLSFLQGNYITLTNLSPHDADRICAMRLSPLGISVHTTDPDLRVKMLGNRFAGESLALLPRFRDAGIEMKGQIVLCPGVNDGDVLRKTLTDLAALDFSSVSVVPVGITKHRENLPLLQPVTRVIAQETLRIIADFPNAMGSDELYLRAEEPLPPAAAYGDFPQLENGVGMLALFREEWQASGMSRTARDEGARRDVCDSAACVGAGIARPHDDTQSWRDASPVAPNCPLTIATGFAAAPMLRELLAGTGVDVRAIPNRFFGETVDVAGLLTGSCLIAELQNTNLGSYVLIPNVMLRHGTTVFLDDLTIEDVEAALGVPVVPISKLDALRGFLECRGFGDAV